MKEDAQTSPAYFLGIDGGGTKTEFLLCDAAGRQCGHAVLGACNPNDVGFAVTAAVLDEGISAVCRDLPAAQISVFAGLAGTLSGDYPAQVTAVLAQRPFARIGCGSDAQNAVAAALGRRDGTVVIAGTGCAAFAQKAGQLFRCGGYGYLLEEGGSGFSIGRDAIRAALLAEAGHGPDTALRESVRAACGHAAVLDALEQFYAGGKREFAAYAPFVFDAYDAGDAVAGQILDRNAAALAELIVTADRFGGAPHDVVLVGGLTARQAIYLPMIERHLPAPGRYRLTASTVRPVLGALCLAGVSDENLR